MSLPHAILGFLNYQPMSGYDLKKHFDESVAHFWSATQSHIYRDLERLEEEGFVTSSLVPQEGKPDRKEHTITQAGREALSAWLSKPMPMESIREGWLIQLFFAHQLSNEQLIDLLEARRAAIGEKLGELQGVAEIIERRKQSAPGRLRRAAATWNATLEYGLAHYEAELAWLEKMIKRAADLPQ